MPICLNITHLFSLIRLRCLCLVVSRRVESATYGSLLPLSVYAQSLRLHEGVNFSPSLFLIPWFKTLVVLPRFYASLGYEPYLSLSMVKRDHVALLVLLNVGFSQPGATK